MVIGHDAPKPAVEVHPRLPRLRFLERPVTHRRGRELVADAELGDELDPYLTDHVLDGERLLPTVIGLEAMAQGVAALSRSRATPVFEDLCVRPIVLPPDRRTAIRVTVLADNEAGGTVALRSESSGFAVDRFTARWRHEPLAMAPPAGLPLPAPAAQPDIDPEDLYGEILWQSGRFRRLRGYRRLTATKCVAEIAPAPPNGWFAPGLAQQLVLGDPGARDAYLHAMQVCIPHARVVLVGVGSLRACATQSPGPWFVHARERRRFAGEWVFDLVVTDAARRIRERWDSVRLRAIAPLAPFGQLARARPAALLAAFVERHLPEGVQVGLVRPMQPPRPPDREPPRLQRDRLDETPSVADRVWTSHAAGLTLVVSGAGSAACDLEVVEHRRWTDLLDEDLSALVDVLVAARGDDPDECATRVWAAHACMRKAGVRPVAPLSIDRDDGDGIVVLVSGRRVVTTCVARVSGSDRALAVAVLTENREAR